MARIAIWSSSVMIVHMISIVLCSEACYLHSHQEHKWLLEKATWLNASVCRFLSPPCMWKHCLGAKVWFFIKCPMGVFHPNFSHMTVVSEHVVALSRKEGLYCISYIFNPILASVTYYLYMLNPSMFGSLLMSERKLSLVVITPSFLRSLTYHSAIPYKCCMVRVLV